MRYLLVILAIFLIALAAWFFSRDYDSNHSGKIKITKCLVTPDHSFAWLDVSISLSQADLPPSAQLIIRDQKIPHAEISKADDSTLLIRFWLDKNILTEKILLDLLGETFLVKEASQTLLLEKNPRTFRDTTW